MCLFPKPPKIKAPPPAPPVYMTSTQEVISPESLEIRNREKRRRMAQGGQQSTILAGAGAAPTAGTKTLLGS